MKVIHDMTTYALLAVLAVAGVIVGILSGIAVIVAAVIPPIIGAVCFAGAEVAAAGNRIIHRTQH